MVLSILLTTGMKRAAAFTPRALISTQFGVSSTLPSSLFSTTDDSSTNTNTANPDNRYPFASVEKKWQTHWSENQTFKTPIRTAASTNPKKYVLDMFPYPSGAGLHVGHPEGYTASDIMSRYWRMKGYDVLHPIGWDSFGLPAEQFAIQTGAKPAITTKTNIATFKRQLKSLGFSYDWEREIATTDEDYVKWTQWIFLQLYKTGLASQSMATVNWCAGLGTVLSNEEVINGLSERGDFPVERLPLRQWVLKITDYADTLEEGLEGMDWPSGTLSAQKQWIGKSVGCSIDFDVKGMESEKVSVFTTRADTLMGVTYVTLAPEHPLVSSVTSPDQKESVDEYVKTTSSRSDLDRTSAKEKTGIFTGGYAIHPLTGDSVPIWIGDYVLGSYGTGAVMAVPAHDERDYEFAQKFGLDIKWVVDPVKGEHDRDAGAYTAPGVSVNSGEFDGLKTAKAIKNVTYKLNEMNKGGAVTTYKLRDWVFSRQRYWGEPIPIYFPVLFPEGVDPATQDPKMEGCEHTIDYDTPFAVEESELPLKLPEMDDFKPGDDPAGCLARAKDWRYFQKDNDPKWYARETNTMPQWAGSCWYYFRFTDPKNAEAAFGATADEAWMPVDLYVGGAEHAVLHLLYARFWHRVLFDLGYTKHKEPFKKLVHQGMILGTDGEKMSKSRGNVVNPDDIVNAQGADALRLYEMFMGPLEAVKPWQTSQVSGVVRFQNKLYSVVKAAVNSDAAMDDETEKILHKTMKKVTEDIESMGFNTAISALMVLTNHLLGLKDQVPKEAAEKLALMVSPMAPHLGEECWNMLGHEDSLAYHPWVEYKEELCVDNTIKMGVQVNGKSRGEIEIAKDASQEDAMEEAMKQAKVSAQLDGKDIKKVIFVPGRILNIVAK